MAQLCSARNWTFLYARSLTKSCRPCHAIRCLKMLKALLPPGLSCPPISSEAMRSHAKPTSSGCHTADLSNSGSFTEGGRQYQLISSSLAPTRANRTDLQGKCFCRSFGRQALQWSQEINASPIMGSLINNTAIKSGLRNHCEEDMFLVMQTKHMFLWPIDCW